MAVLFLKKRQGSDFDYLKPMRSCIALNFRSKFIDATSIHILRLSFNAQSSFLCSNPAGNRRYMSSFSLACWNADVISICFPFRLCITVSVFTTRMVFHGTTGSTYYM
jgi:hypothetical protein